MQNWGSEVGSRMTGMWLVFYATGSVEYMTELFRKSETVAEAALRQE